jgi:hypothetical protein
MQKKYKLYLLSSLALAALLAGIFGANFAFAKQQHVSSTQAKHALGSAISSNAGVPHVVNMHNVPAATAKQLHQKQRLLPFLYPGGSAKYATLKAGAAHNRGAPVVAHPLPTTSNVTPNTPTATKNFSGMADSGVICSYFGSGCQPPDMALATSNQWVLQHVNTSVAVYDTSGNIQPGWPKNSQQFFGVPNPPNNCDPAGPFLSDPRAFYDPNTGRFWTAILQVENAFGVAPNCPFLSGYWIAVSQTSDPNGSWNVYFFDMALGNPNAADYTQFGFDAKNIYFSGNMFPVSNSGNFYAQIMGANKTRMENGKSVTAYGFRNLVSPLDGSLVDTVQPVETEAPSNGVPPVGLFINATNGNCATNTCSGMTIWGIHNPGTASESLNAVYVPTTSYAFAPNADQPTCIQCVETIDLRITATPVYHDGLITFAIDTGVANNSLVDVPGIFWGEVKPQIVNQFLTGGSVYQSGYFAFGGDQDASFGALMPDNNGNLIMVYDTMSSTLNPSIAYTGRRATFTLGQFHDAGRFLKKGGAPTLDSRWGDYEATSYDGPSFDHIWFASQYSGANQDWHTRIGETQFVLK